MFRGRPKRVWKQRYRDNHFLDCRVYNLALLEYLGFSKMTSEDWAERERGAPAGEELAWKAAAMAGVDGQDTDGEAPAGEAEVTVVAPEGRKLTWGEAVDKFKRRRMMADDDVRAGEELARAWLDGKSELIDDLAALVDGMDRPLDGTARASRSRCSLGAQGQGSRGIRTHRGADEGAANTRGAARAGLRRRRIPTADA